MLWFNQDKRQKLAEALENIVSDRTEFETMLQPFLLVQHEHVTPHEIATSIDKLNETQEFDELLKRVKKMISDDAQLAHLLLEMRRKNTLRFIQGTQDENIHRIYT